MRRIFEKGEQEIWEELRPKEKGLHLDLAHFSAQILDEAKKKKKKEKKGHHPNSALVSDYIFFPNSKGGEGMTQFCALFLHIYALLAPQKGGYMLTAIGVARIFWLGGAQTTYHMQWRHWKFSKKELFVGQGYRRMEDLKP